MVFSTQKMVFLTQKVIFSVKKMIFLTHKMVFSIKKMVFRVNKMVFLTQKMVFSTHKMVFWVDKMTLSIQKIVFGMGIGPFSPTSLYQLRGLLVARLVIGQKTKPSFAERLLSIIHLLKLPVAFFPWPLFGLGHQGFAA